MMSVGVPNLYITSKPTHTIYVKLTVVSRLMQASISLVLLAPPQTLSVLVEGRVGVSAVELGYIGLGYIG